MRPVGRRLKNVGVQLPILCPRRWPFLSAFIIGIVFLSVAWRLLPRERSSGSSQGPFEIADYTTEALLPTGSPLVGKTVGDLEALGEDDVAVAAIVREQRHRYVPAGHWILFENDLLVLEGDADTLKKVIDTAKLVDGREADRDGTGPSERQQRDRGGRDGALRADRQFGWRHAPA